MVDVEDAVRAQVREILFIRLGGLQIHRREGAGALRDARAGVIAVDLDDVVGAVAVAQEASTLTRPNVHRRIVKDVADVSRVRAGRELDDGRHQLDRIDVGGTVHQGGLRLLATGAPDDQDALPRIALQIVRRQDADLPEVLGEAGFVAADPFPQRPEVAVELVEVARLIPAVVLNGLSITVEMPGRGDLG